MGICVVVAVENQEEPPVDVRSDGKPLGWIVAGWIWYPKVIQAMGLAPESVKALSLLDYGPYRDEGETPTNAWQDPSILKAALKNVGAALARMRNNPSELERLRAASQEYEGDYFGSDSDWWDSTNEDIEDAIKTCEWAISHKKRVALVAS